MNIGYSLDFVNTSALRSVNLSFHNSKSIFGGNIFDEDTGSQIAEVTLAERTLSIKNVPDNDLCENAISISCGNPVSGSTVDASQSGLATLSCTGGTPADVFYTLDVESGNEYTVTVVGADFDAVLAIYSGLCDNLLELACADNGIGTGLEESITFTATTTETVIIRTYDWSSTAGDFTITALCTTSSIGESDVFAGTYIFPNPISVNDFYVNAPKLNGERVEVIIKDVAGKQIFHENLNCFGNRITVSLNRVLTSGVYLVTLKNSDQDYTIRLLKE